MPLLVNFILPVRSVFFLWLIAFFYALVVGLVLQKLILPMMPSMHAGHGLMRDDAIFFHGVAVAMAEQIQMHGWSEWRLIPSASATGHVGILAAVYALLGPEPAWFLPINAGFHALGAVLLVLIALQIEPSRNGFRGGLVAAFCFLVFPSALVWFGQNHKDAFVITGFLLCLLAFLRSLELREWRGIFANSLMFAAGIGLVSIMRAHLVMVYLAAFFGAFGLACIAWSLKGDKKAGLPRLGNLLLLVLIGALTLPSVPSKNEFAEGGGSILGSWNWKASSYLPQKIDQLFEKVSSVRTHFVNYGLSVEAGSIIDSSSTPQSASEMIAYLPRAAQIGLLAPFPSFWMERLSLPRVIGAFETLVFYLFIPGALYLLFRRFSLPSLLCVAVAGSVLIVHSYVSPNLGTLHRVRYGQWLPLLMVGACGWMLLLERLAEKFGRGGGGGAATGHQAALISGTRAAGAGLMVMLVSLLGFLGLLIRDLMLIDKVGFGAGLDSYYLAMMPPMFFIALLAAPLGDALSTRIAQLSERMHIQKLLGAVSAFTLLLFGIVSVLLLLFADSIFSAFVSDGQFSHAVQLFPIALLLLVLSGVIVAGNSLINSYGRPMLAAGAQLVAPAVVVGSILLAGDSDVLVVAMVGMALGQLGNLLLLSIFLYRYRFNVLPSSLQPLRAEGEMLQNFKWLSLCALLTGLAVPVNYWFAGGIGVGAVSTWALGSKLVQVSSLMGAAILAAVFVPYMSRVVALGGGARIRGDLFTSLIVGAWGCTLVIAAVFVFAEPIIFSAMSSLEDEAAALRLVEIIKLGALQLPFVLTSLILFKLCAVSAVSTKAVVSAFFGLLVNILLSFIFVPLFGLAGLALAWTLASLAASLAAIMMTRRQSHLAGRDIIVILATWCFLGGVAASIHLKSFMAVFLVFIFGVVMIMVQLRIFSRLRAEFV
ncbi:lipid II flippase MurJ [Pseudomonas sp.]|uniref:lipid II flippase MurJ n=1 Tax=Pseudomonas sp. TaxID=306 RepID=UPI003C72D028